MLCQTKKQRSFIYPYVVFAKIELVNTCKFAILAHGETKLRFSMMFAQMAGDPVSSQRIYAI